MLSVNDPNNMSEEFENLNLPANNASPIENVKIYKPKEKNHEVEQIIPISDGFGKKYPCNKCTYVTSYKDSLKKHLDFTHNGFKVICEECNKIYTSMSALGRHRAIIHGGKVFNCDKCEYQSKSSESLRSHRLRLFH